VSIPADFRILTAEGRIARNQYNEANRQAALSVISRGHSPSVPGHLAGGKMSAEEVQAATSFLPKRPPGRGT
jgi:hypothetical protein